MEKVACSSVICDSLGGFIRGFAANFGQCPITIVEICGVYYVLELVWSLDFHCVILEMDSFSAIVLIQHCGDMKHS